MPEPTRTFAALPACALLFALASFSTPSVWSQTAPSGSNSDVHPITTLPPRPVVPTAAASTFATLVIAAPATTLASADVPVFAPEDSAPAAAAVSSSRPVEAPAALHSDTLHAVVAEPPPPPSYAGGRAYLPFSAFAIGVKVGVAGIGFDLATPLAQRFNLRAGASFFQYSGSYIVDGTIVNGEAKLRSANLSVDWFPFNNRFRISPGVILYNGNNLNAAASVPGGQTFELNDQTYTSSPSDPIHGSASLTFGNRTAPSLTIGAGNMIPRHGNSHWSVPFEVGFEYINNPMLTLALAGSACQQGVCQNVGTNPQFQANLQAENNELNSDIHDLRFFPILSLGLAYKFGR